MERARDLFLLPLRAAGALVRIGGRIVVGSVGFVLMGVGLLFIEPFGLIYLGVPFLAIGLLLLVKAVF